MYLYNHDNALVWWQDALQVAEEVRERFLKENGGLESSFMVEALLTHTHFPLYVCVCAPAHVCRE